MMVVTLQNHPGIANSTSGLNAAIHGGPLGKEGPHCPLGVFLVMGLVYTMGHVRDACIALVIGNRPTTMHMAGLVPMLSTSLHNCGS